MPREKLRQRDALGNVVLGNFGSYQCKCKCKCSIDVLLMCTPTSALFETMDVQPRLQIPSPGGLLKANPQWLGLSWQQNWAPALLIQSVLLFQMYTFKTLPLHLSLSNWAVGFGFIIFITSLNIHPCSKQEPADTQELRHWETDFLHPVCEGYQSGLIKYSCSGP